MQILLVIRRVSYYTESVEIQKQKAGGIQMLAVCSGGCGREELSMEIKREQVNKTLIISLVGRLDTQTAPLLDAELKKGLANVKELFWDFSGLEYMTSAGIRELLIAQNMLEDDGHMKVIHANEAIRNALYLTGLTDLLG